MENGNVRKYWFSWTECLLVFGLILINLGCFLGKSEIVDVWFRFVVHNLDVRYWTWKSFIAVLIVFIIVTLRTRIKQGNFDHCRILIVIILFFAGVTSFRFGVEMAWNYTGKTFIVRQRPKGTPVANEYSPLDYKVHVPIGYYGIGNKRLLIVFLHGAGNVNKDIEDIKEDLVNHLMPDMKKNFPFVVISPASGKHGWNTVQILQILNETTIRWNIDPHRIYLTGYSMGGFGTFRTACDSPKTFAAIVPIAGGGDIGKAGQLKDVPTWAFHGDADEVVPYESSSKMIEAMQTVGCNDIKLTTLNGAGHGIMNDVYSKPELYYWLLEKRK
jgi:predicted esterase